MARIDFVKHASHPLARLQEVEGYLHDALGGTLLTLVKLVASQRNGCAYCIHMHGTTAMRAGETVERMLLSVAADESSLFDARERAAIAWCKTLTDVAEQGAPDVAYERVRAHFSEQEVADLTLAVGMINLWNRVMIGLQSDHPATHSRVEPQAAAAHG